MRPRAGSRADVDDYLSAEEGDARGTDGVDYADDEYDGGGQGGEREAYESFEEEVRSREGSAWYPPEWHQPQFDGLKLVCPLLLANRTAPVLRLTPHPCSSPRKHPHLRPGHAKLLQHPRSSLRSNAPNERCRSA